MTPANYDKHFKVLGKIVRLHDTAVGADEATLRTLISRLYDQVATGESASYEATKLTASFAPTLDQAINAMSSFIRNVVFDLAKTYMADPLFTADMTTPPTSSGAAIVAAALREEMIADAKTLSDETTTGFVNYFKNVMGGGGTWNTASDANADSKDSVYVIDAIVP